VARLNLHSNISAQASNIAFAIAERLAGSHFCSLSIAVLRHVSAIARSSSFMFHLGNLVEDAGAHSRLLTALHFRDGLKVSLLCQTLFPRSLIRGSVPRSLDMLSTSIVATMDRSVRAIEVKEEHTRTLLRQRLLRIRILSSCFARL
jgi:hypothetical protein